VSPSFRTPFGIDPKRQHGGFSLGRLAEEAIMNVHFIKHLLVIILLAYAGGCAHTFVPSMGEDFEPGTIPEFESKNAVKLVNVQTDTESVTFLRSMWDYYLANRQECSDVAIAIVKRELSKRGMQILDNGAKSLKLSVETVDSSGAGYWEVFVRLRVEAGNGYIAEYEGTSDAWTPYTATGAADGALSDSVVNMLKDPKIIEYLTK
jgi:hypothetical protein